MLNISLQLARTLEAAQPILNSWQLGSQLPTAKE